MIAIKELIWDDWNVEHIARHDVAPDEVAQVCQSDPVVQRVKKGRLAVIGKTEESRTLVVILDPEQREGVYYPVTAYTASRKYRKVYEEKRGEDAA